MAQERMEIDSMSSPTYIKERILLPPSITFQSDVISPNNRVILSSRDFLFRSLSESCIESPSKRQGHKENKENEHPSPWCINTNLSVPMTDVVSSPEEAGNSPFLARKEQPQIAGKRSPAVKQITEEFFGQTRTRELKAGIVPIPEEDPEYVYKLPLQESSVFKCISPDTVVDVLNNRHHYGYEEVFVIDCRFDYEYENGHIRTAVNLSDPKQVIDTFTKTKSLYTLQNAICLIFHCEFSSHRAPKLYTALREMDRVSNVWPKLCYPEMYILAGGYRRFFAERPEYCDGVYVEMRDPMYADRLEKAKGKLQKKKSKTRFLSQSNGRIEFNSNNQTPVRSPSLQSIFSRSNLDSPYF